MGADAVIIGTPFFSEIYPGYIDGNFRFTSVHPVAGISCSTSLSHVDTPPFLYPNFIIRIAETVCPLKSLTLNSPIEDLIRNQPSAAINQPTPAQN